jgi:hypothetical protein
VYGNDVLTMEDADLVGHHEHLDVIANEAVRYAVPDRIDVDQRVIGDASPQPTADRRSPTTSMPGTRAASFASSCRSASADNQIGYYLTEIPQAVQSKATGSRR